MSKQTYRLVADSSLWEGFARLVDFQGKLSQYNYSVSETQADYRALSSDWQSVGDDIRAAISKFQENFARELSG